MGDVFEFPGNMGKTETSARSHEELTKALSTINKFEIASSTLERLIIEKDAAGRRLLDAEHALICGSVDGVSYSQLEVQKIIVLRKSEYKKASEKLQEYKKRFKI